MKPNTLFRFIGSVAILFGLVTIMAGGSVLFGGESFRQQAGNYIPFVLVFNFLAGFAYVITGAGLLAMKKWSAVLAGVIATANMFVFVALAIHIFMGGDHETRTVLAMVFRTVVWGAIFAIAYRRFLSARAVAWKGDDGVLQ